VDVQQYCRDHGWRWHLGVKSDTHYRADDGAWQPLRTIPIQPGQRRYVQGITLTAHHAFGLSRVDFFQCRLTPRANLPHPGEQNGLSVTKICDSRFFASGCPIEEIAVE
jgi:hypothetical protein